MNDGNKKKQKNERDLFPQHDCNKIEIYAIKTINILMLSAFQYF